MFGIDWDKLIRNLTGAKYCLHRKPGEYSKPTTLGEAIENVETAGARVDTMHAAVLQLIQEVDVLHSDVLAIREALNIPPDSPAIPADGHPAAMTGGKGPAPAAPAPPPGVVR